MIISGTTVRNYVSRCKESPYKFQELLAIDDPTLAEIIYPTPAAEASDETIEADPGRKVFEASGDHYLKELMLPGITKQLLWEEYFGQHPGGYRYSQFCELLRRYQKTKEVSMHFEYRFDDLLTIDFAGDKLSYTEKPTGLVVQCQVLVCVLPLSGYSYVEALPNASLPQLVKSLNNCLRFIGGAPASLKCDNIRQAVTRACRYEAVFTSMITDWALHNNIHLKTARVRKPRDKAQVENEVKITYSRIYAPLMDRVFHSIDELNKAVIQKLKKHHRKPFQKKDYNRVDLFTQSEQPLLQELPIEPYVMKYFAESKVQRNYHVMIGEDRHNYSVPYSYVGKTLRIVYDTDIVEVFCQYQRVNVQGTHARCS